MELNLNMTSQDFRRAADEITRFGTQLKKKITLFVSRLADKGIQAALNANYGSLAAYIVFSKETSEYGAIVVAKETSQLTADWLGHENVKISPLLMTEFGSGKYAVYLEKADGSIEGELSDGTPVGRGSFPNQKYAFRDQWLYRDKDGVLHASGGIYPTRPLHHAMEEMIAQIETTAREVFGYGSI